jgi:phosphoglucosamine mutase
MTADVALAIGRATASVCRRGEHRHRILIGKDTRLSGYMIESALTSGIASVGVDVLLVGPIPTPGIAHLTRTMRADAGIVISASHNPFEDNGIKIFSREGFKISDAMEEQIEAMVLSNDNMPPVSSPANVGKASRIDDAVGRYIEFCKRTFPDNLTLDGLKLVLDCANGATYRVAPTIFRELGAEVVAIHNTPDGRNINADCGSQFTDDLKQEVLKQGADAGLAFDGDGDRLIAVDETGNELSGDHLIAICAVDMKRRGILPEDLVILTPMSNLAMRLALKKAGITCEDAAVGDRNVLELMQRRGAALGGEQSGHIIFLDRQVGTHHFPRPSHHRRWHRLGSADHGGTATLGPNHVRPRNHLHSVTPGPHQC